MFGILIDGPGYVFFDNQHMTNNVTLPQSVLNKSKNEIFYRRFHKTQASEVIIVHWIHGEYNKTDL